LLFVYRIPILFEYSFDLSPAFEYNVFPYSENTRRQFRFLYRIGVNRFVYAQETIFFKLSETLGQHVLSGFFDLREPWGTTAIALTCSQYLDDASKYRLEISGSLSLRLIEGLSLRLQGNYAMIRDQISLQRASPNPEDVLQQRIQLGTSFSYFASFGVSYTFGSIYNNVVNPRFGG
jgi:hypothetical protein